MAVVGAALLPRALLDAVYVSNGQSDAGWVVASGALDGSLLWAVVVLSAFLGVVVHARVKLRSTVNAMLVAFAAALAALPASALIVYTLAVWFRLLIGGKV